MQTPSDSVDLLRKLTWKVKHASESALGGEYRSAFRGRGWEFNQVVKYEYGDDVRDIDWNVTARRGELYRKKFIEEREITLVLLFQDSASLLFGTAGKTKREALMEVAALFGIMASLDRDRFGYVYLGGGGHHFQKPLRGQKAIRQATASFLAHTEPDPSDPSSPDIPWDMLIRAIPRHSIVVWMGDFPAESSTPEIWPIFKRRFQTIGVRIDDPWDRQLPDEGSLSTYDPISGELVLLNTRSPLQQMRHREWKEARDRHFEKLFPRNLDRLLLLTTDPPLESLIHFFVAREKAKS